MLNMASKFDLKDKKLLSELDKNCRQSNQQLARKIGLSKDAIAYRILRFEEKGIIQGYRTIIDFQRLGYIQYRILLRLVNIDEKSFSEFIYDLKQERMVWVIGVNEGEWDLAFTCLVKSNLDFYMFYEQLKKKFRRNIKDELISQILKYQEFPRYYILNDAPPLLKKMDFNKECVDLDDIDRNILELLSDNARIKLINIASKLKLSSMLVYQRMKKLEEKKVILGYRSNIYVMELGRDYYGIKMTLDNYSEKEKILKEILTLKETTAIIWTVGGYDVEFDLEVIDTKQYQDIINKLRNKFSSIREIRFIRSKEYFKLTHMPI